MATKTRPAQTIAAQEPDTEHAAQITAIPIPLLLTASGLYQYQLQFPTLPTPLPSIPITIPLRMSLEAEASAAEAAAGAIGIPSAIATLSLLLLREELRLDVDGRYPLMVASGTRYSLGMQTHWIANLTAAGTDTWNGVIWYKDGNTIGFPYTNVKIHAVRSLFPNLRSATVTYTGGGAAPLIRPYTFVSVYAHPVELEFDTAAGTSRVTDYNTGSHPNRPAGLPIELLTIEKVYQRAGFNVTRSGGDTIVPLVPAAGADLKWSNAEMHDAMQVHWSHFANKPQWALWTFFASLHGMGTSLGGIMFDDIGAQQRQGTAIFEGCVHQGAAGR